MKDLGKEISLTTYYPWVMSDRPWLGAQGTGCNSLSLCNVWASRCSWEVTAVSEEGPTKIEDTIATKI